MEYEHLAKAILYTDAADNNLQVRPVDVRRMDGILGDVLGVGYPAQKMLAETVTDLMGGADIVDADLFGVMIYGMIVGTLRANPLYTASDEWPLSEMEMRQLAIYHMEQLK